MTSGKLYGIRFSEQSTPFAPNTAFDKCCIVIKIHLGFEIIAPEDNISASSTLRHDEIKVFFIKE
jgi:hypothetical protein